jgi:hypothetical protein
MASTQDDRTVSRRDELIFTRGSSGRLVLESVAYAGEPVHVFRGFPGELSAHARRPRSTEETGALVACAR